jgi:hypothetical protein
MTFGTKLKSILARKL